MVLSHLSTAFAQAAPTAPQAPSIIGGLVPMVLLVIIFYFLLIRPQQKKSKEHAQMLKTIRSGDKVVTNGGIIGSVITVKEKSISIRSADAKFEITKSAVAEIIERSGESSES